MSKTLRVALAIGLAVGVLALSGGAAMAKGGNAGAQAPGNESFGQIQKYLMQIPNENQFLSALDYHVDLGTITQAEAGRIEKHWYKVVTPDGGPIG